ncbi:AAA family ATPase [Chelatococcus asaccharovorans]|nr:ATP-binding protein [Chelatococcus asaccharovorans]
MSPVKTDWSTVDTQVRHDGKEIVLPGDPTRMGYDDAIRTIQRIKEQEEQVFDVTETVAGPAWDAIVALNRAMQDIYGVVLAQSRMTFFGEIKPDLLTVITGPHVADRVQVPVGQMSLPNVSAPVIVGLFGGGAYIKGEVRRKDRTILIEIANRARQFMREASIYRGRAISLLVDDDGDISLSQQPEFMDLAGVTESQMIHTAETEALIRTNILSPLRNTAACRKHKIPLKRGILLEGRYGTGKTLTARVTAKVAIDNGWTFVMLNRSQGLKAAIEFAKAYQPCVIFAEDIDRAADREDEEVNDLVNMLDGLITKDMEMMVVLTTNFIDKIDRALLRPGRFDAVISIQPPDAATAVRVIKAYAGNLLPEDTDLTGVADLVAGQIPAMIREVVERAKLAMLSESRASLSAEDLYVSALGMKRHQELLEPKENEPTARDRLADGLIDIIREAFGEVDVSTDDLSGQLKRLDDRVRGSFRKQAEDLSTVKNIAAAGAESSKKGLDKTEQVLRAVNEV